MQRREKLRRTAALRVVGVGGGGITAIEQLMKHGIKGIDFIVVDTDAESLHKSQAPIRILIDPKLAAAEGGDLLRVGAPPQPYPIQTAIRNLRSALFGSDMVFIIGGLGGQTAAGAANNVAHIAKEHQAVILGILTLPFRFEGHARAQAAERGVNQLTPLVDSLMLIANDRLMKILPEGIAFHETYRLAHHIWRQSIESISELVNKPGLINVDFADVRTIMLKGGAAIIATGRGQGAERAVLAAHQAVNGDLLGASIRGAQGILFNVTGGPDVSLLEINQAAAVINARAHPDAYLIFGAAVDNSLTDTVEITLIATGLRPTFPSRGRFLLFKS